MSIIKDSYRYFKDILDSDRALEKRIVEYAPVAYTKGKHTGENKAMSENNELLTAEDVARIMKVHIRTVRQWVNDGKLDVIRIGAHDYRIMRADLDKFIEERRERRTPKNRPPIDV